MSADTSAARQDLIDTLKNRLKTFFPKTCEPTLNRLIQNVYQHVALRDLQRYAESDLAGLTVSLWQFIESWEDRNSKVKVFNPDIEQDEWQSTHSIVLVLVPDMPFILDSLRLTLDSFGARIHTIMHSEFPSVRNKKGKLTGFDDEKGVSELLVYFEIDRETNSEQINVIEQEILSVLADIALVSKDFKAMQDKTADIIDLLAAEPPVGIESEVVDETRIFLKWLAANHFTFLAYDEYQIVSNEITQLEGTELGLFKKRNKPKVEIIDQNYNQMAEFVFEPSLINFHKSGKKSRIHRHAYSDYVLIKRFDSNGKVIGGMRFLGLFTSSVYNNSPQNVPVVRKKIEKALQLSGFEPGSHNYKELTQILFRFPRDELIQASVSELLSVTLKILAIHERRQVRLFLRKDPYGRFVSVLFYIPKDIYNTRLRENVRKMLMTYFDVEGWDFTTFFSESLLARTRCVFRLREPFIGDIDVELLEQKAINIARQWIDELSESLSDSYGEEKGNDIFQQYAEAFPTSYKEHYSARIAVADIQRMEKLYEQDGQSMAINLYRNLDPTGSQLKLKIFHQNESLLLSDLIPVLENLGLKVMDETPFKIKRQETSFCYIYDFSLIYEENVDLDPNKLKDSFDDAFTNIWYGNAENDHFNQLVIKAGLTWREVAMFRGYAKYMRQLGFSFSPQFIAETLLRHQPAVDLLAWLFAYRFNAEYSKKRDKQYADFGVKLTDYLESIQNLSEDRIIRKYMELIDATLRTNFYQVDASGNRKSYVSFKFDPRAISDMPEPKPMYEIFVYSPWVEGVHLRGGKVARGGLRWSDRIEDFRTEVLGLVKAQQVKNAIIVPVGAKGGFVAKQPPIDGGREALHANGIYCYKLFIRGLLDITDNLVDGEVVPPPGVVRYDDDDPYLVVAADKGTATFSDIANEVAISYGHWLGDAFASGGSNGYDHKKMGITAKGAWVSVQRHFRELEINVQKEEFTVVGIGDMAGDVFGNGLLRSETAKLVAAFNHLHIFIDPDPDPASSFRERQRLFDMPRSSWSDYNSELISKGGGVFMRTAKYVTVSPEMQKRFNIKDIKITPNELIVYLLKSEVDLLWNGGIGTYVKSSFESNTDVGDKSNDSIRINGADLNAKVVGEGGNLGMTQLGRVEFALKGGRLFTDFIDNAGGVDCSDHEVNIKILLDGMVTNGDMTVKQRNQKLEKMTEEISELVLTNNYQQAQALGIFLVESVSRLEEYHRLINTLSEEGKLNPELEFLPDDETFAERKAEGRGLVAPELSVLISYVKGILKEELISSDIADDKRAEKELESAFPASLIKEYGVYARNHRLRREIVATQIANDIYNHVGISFVHRLKESTGAGSDQIAKGYLVARELFNLHDIARQIETLDYQVNADVQSSMFLQMARTMRRASRWIVKNNRLGIDVAELIDRYQNAFKQLNEHFTELLQGGARNNWQNLLQKYIEQGVPEALAARVVSVDYLYSCLGMINVANAINCDVIETAQTFFAIGERLNLVDFVAQLNSLSVSSHWQARARESYRDDIDWQQRRITQGIMANKEEGKEMNVIIDEWMEKNDILISRWNKMVREVLNVGDTEFSMYAVAIRELLDLSQATILE